MITGTNSEIIKAVEIKDSYNYSQFYFSML